MNISTESEQSQDVASEGLRLIQAPSSEGAGTAGARGLAPNLWDTENEHLYQQNSTVRNTQSDKSIFVARITAVKSTILNPPALL